MSETDESGDKRLLFVHGDPVGTLLLERFRLNYWSAAIVVLVVLGIPIYTIAAIKGHWIGERGLLKDVMWWWAQFVSSPAVLVFLFWMPQGIRSILDGLRNNGVILVPEHQQRGDDAYMGFMKDFDRTLARPIWAVVSLILAAVWIFGPARIWNSGAEKWNGGAAASYDGFAFWGNLVYITVIFYFWFFLAIRGAVVVAWLNRLFQEFEIHVKGLDSDKVGGFSPLGRIVPKVGLVIAIAGATLGVIVMDGQVTHGASLQEILSDTAVRTLSAGYLIAAFGLFFILMRGAHLAMKRYRTSQLQRISDNFESEYAVTQTRLAFLSSDEAECLDRLEKTAALHSVVATFPVWPISTRGIAQFFSLILVPIIIGIILALIMDWIESFASVP